LDEASQFAKISKFTLKAMILSGRLRGVEIGVGHQRRHYRIVKNDLLAFFGINTADYGKTGDASQTSMPNRSSSPSQGVRGNRRRD